LDRAGRDEEPDFCGAFPRPAVGMGNAAGGLRHVAGFRDEGAVSDEELDFALDDEEDLVLEAMDVRWHPETGEHGLMGEEHGPARVGDADLDGRFKTEEGEDSARL